ncbi:MAG TPA: response regulator [Nitrospiraceae bacterium]
MRCVIADDSKITRDRVKAYLQVAGHETVGAAANGKEALDMCRLHLPDIAILDISMPVMNGDIAGMHIIREKLARFVIIASSQMQAATVDQVTDAGCKVISKPFRQEKFLSLLAKIVADG